MMNRKNEMNYKETTKMNGKKYARSTMIIVLIIFLIFALICTKRYLTALTPSTNIVENIETTEVEEMPIYEETKETNEIEDTKVVETDVEEMEIEEKTKEETQMGSIEETNTPKLETKKEEHIHNFNSEVTRAATCGEDGIRMYTCSCGEMYTETIKATGAHNFTSSIIKNPSCVEEGSKMYTCTTCGNMYTESIGRTNDHSWATRHIDEVGHYESNETHRVTFKRCDCGFEVNGDMPNAAEIWRNHTRECNKGYINWREDVPNDSKYVVDTPAYDETYCTICGIIK